MSASSNNIVIKITDNIDQNIIVKIKGIGDAARQSANDVLTLTAQLALLSNSTASLTTALGALNTVQKNLNSTQNTTTNSINKLTGSTANLIARVGAAELGMGRLGGVIAQLGTAAAGATPFIIAALAIVAIVTAVEVYRTFEESARKLVEAQIEVAKTNQSISDSILTEKENLIGLTDGPLAKYQQQLIDIQSKSIPVQLADINKEFDTQKSTLNTIVSFLERYAALTGSISLVGIIGALHPQKTSESFSIQDAQDFVAAQEKIRAQGLQFRELSKDDLKQIEDDSRKAADASVHNNELGLASEIATLKHAIETKQQLALQQTGATRTITDQSIGYLKESYNRDLLAYAQYIGKKKNLTGDVAKAQAAEQLKQFQDEVNQLKQRQQFTSPQEILRLRQQQQAGTARDTAAPGSLAARAPLTLQNQRTIARDIGEAQQAVERQNKSVTELIQRYQQSTLASGAYTDALKEEAAYQKANNEVLRLTGSLQEDILEPIYKSIDAEIESAKVNREKVEVYQRFQGPLQTYNALLKASDQLVKDGVINDTQAAVAKAQALRIYQDSINPLNEYNIELQHQAGLLNLVGRELTVATEIDRVRQDLQKQGYDLTTTQIQQYTQYLTQLESFKNIQQELNNLWEQNAGQIQKLVEYQKALNQAQSQGIITQQQYKIATAQNNVALATQNLIEQQGATLRDQVIVTFGNYLKNYQGLTKGFTDAYSQAFASIADGAANSIGRAIAFSENLGDAMANVARTVASDLISAFIKLGIQWLLTEAIGRSVGQATTAATIATAAATSAAWAPAAAFSALATLGANAAPAAAAIAGTVALSDALAIFHFARGGYVSGPGTGTSDSILAAISTGEYVVNARATAKHLDLLNAINSNSISRSSYGGSQGAVASNGTNLLVQVVHDGSTNVNVEQTDHNTIRIIAQHEAKAVVRSEAAGVVASDMSNPNSRTSKAVQQHFVAPRKR